MFNTWIVPLLGLIFLPQTTIVNVDSTNANAIATVHFYSPHPGEPDWLGLTGRLP